MVLIMKTIQSQIIDLQERLSEVETKDITKGQLRLLFTLDERAAQAIYREQAKAAAAAGTASAEQGIFLAMDDDWRDGPVGFYRNDENFLAGVDFYASIGLLDPERPQAIRDELATL